MLNQMIPPRRIMLSGGGIKAVALIGSIKHLNEKGLLHSVKEYCGVSAGAWMAFMMACKVPIPVLERLILELDFGVVRNVKPDAIIGFPETFGLDDGSNFVNLLEIIFRTILKLDVSTTFADLDIDKTIQFRCWATDLTMRTSREFSLKETPRARIIDALRATTAIPMYFIPHIDPLTGNMLSDGGIQGNLPLHYLNEDECSETLAIGFHSTSETSTPQDLIQFMKAVFDCMVISRNEDIMERWKHNIMRISTGNYPSWNFEASREDRLMLLNKGVDGARAWLDKPPYRTVLRRNSS
jgi:predicted acylesterase/phospholipase RssA